MKGSNAMKTLLVLSLLFMSFVVEAKKMSFEDAKAYLEDESKAVFEPGEPPGQTSQDLAFLRFVAGDWKRALTLLEYHAPDRRQRSLIVVAAECMPARDYVRFLNGVCDLIESKKLKEIPGWSFGLGSFLKESFLEYNYDQPEVAALIDRIEAIYKIYEPEKWGNYFSAIKSGDAKKDHVRMLTSCSDPMPESYKDNSKEVYIALEKEHKKLLAEESKKAKGKVKPEPTPRGKKIVRMVDEDGSVRITEVDAPPEDAPVGDKPTPWKLPLLIGTLIASAGVVAWWCFKKKQAK